MLTGPSRLENKVAVLLWNGAAQTLATTFNLGFFRCQRNFVAVSLRFSLISHW